MIKIRVYLEKYAICYWSLPEIVTCFANSLHFFHALSSITISVPNLKVAWETVINILLINSHDTKALKTLNKEPVLFFLVAWSQVNKIPLVSMSINV